MTLIVRGATPACHSCSYWQSQQDRPDFPGDGSCRLTPPSLFMLEGGVILSVFPTTNAEHWCGQYSPRPKLRLRTPKPPRKPKPAARKTTTKAQGGRVR